jgi:hypothetical protein
MGAQAFRLGAPSFLNALEYTQADMQGVACSF